MADPRAPGFFRLSSRICCSDDKQTCEMTLLVLVYTSKSRIKFDIQQVH